MLLEIHSHTTEHSPCSHVSAADLIRHCSQNDVQGLVLTDHHYLWPVHELDALVKTCAVPDHFLVMAGQEVTTSDYGDVLVYGANASIQRGVSLADLRGRFPRAALILAHPFRNGRQPTEQTLCHPALDAIEIFNTNQRVCENYRGLLAWHRYKFNAIGGSDIHSSNCAVYPTDFMHPVNNVIELAEEIRAGRCRPLLRETPRSGTSNNRVTELAFSLFGKRNTKRVIVKSHENANALKEGKRSHQIMSAIAERGFRQGSYRIAEPLDDDDANLVLFEQCIEGLSLFDKLLQADLDQTGQYVALGARWLARLHNMRLRITPTHEFLENETHRLHRYTFILSKVNHPHKERIEAIRDTVLYMEKVRYDQHPELLVQGHGDYHPKNIFIGQDYPDDPGSRFAAAIDLDSSFQLPPAFDVGTFWVQYKNQLHPHPHILEKVPPQMFLESYLSEIEYPTHDFAAEIELFKARTALSIIYYLVKVGLGESENLWRILVSAEKSLRRLSAETSV